MAMTFDETAKTSLSPYFRKAVPAPAAGSFALDLPCGLGRHSFWLAEAGFEVVAADIDEPSIASLRRTAPQHTGGKPIHCVAVNAHVPLPFRDSQFDLAVVVHFVSAPLLDELARVLRPGGRLVFETFGGQGGNWIGLPKPGAVRQQLETHFQVLDYVERLVGPEGHQTAVVKATAVRLG